MLRLNPADSISAVSNGAAATTNPSVIVRYLNGGPRAAAVALAGVAPVVLLTGAVVAQSNFVEVDTISIANVDTQSNTITLSCTIGGVTLNFAVITMAAGDHANIDSTGKITVANSVGQNRTETTGGTTSNFTTINAATATLAINGLAGAQGGAVTMTGGTSSTSGNAGGALTRTGGAPGVTGVGGAINDTGGAGGATSGAGGALSRTGGAGTNGNAAGGAILDTGGAGQGSAAGGACGQTGGAGGLTGAGGALNYISGAGGGTSGAAGAINITVGACTSGNGSAITITAGNGATGTNAGGMINLVPGAPVSTGLVGEVQVNANSNLIYVQVALTATDASRAVHICTRPMILKTVSFMHTTGSTSGTLQIEKLTGTTAAGSGTTLLTGTIDLSTTTVANTTTNGTLIATVASLKFATGDRCSVKIGGTMTSLVGGIVTIGFAPI